MTVKHVRLWEVQGEERIEGRAYPIRRHYNILAETLQEAVEHVTRKYPGVELHQVVCRSSARDVEWAE